MSHDDTGAVLVIASFDERFDFQFLAELAGLCPRLRFDLYGWTRPGDEETAKQLRALPGRVSNIAYCGPYTMEGLPAILRRYRVTVAPYKANSPLTRYIDPLRFYHCLNAGLEVISTPIPQALAMQAAIHVAADPAAGAAIIAGLRAGRGAKQQDYKPITWQQRARRLAEIVAALPRTIALLRRQRTP